MSDETYIVVLDRDMDFCRLFRQDSENIPAGETLWEGNGLRRGYDAMIRLNKERRPVHAYNVCSSVNRNGRTVYRIFKDEPAKGFETVSVFYDHASAMAEMKRLAAERNAAEDAEKARLRAIMARVGLTSRRIPKFTDKDLVYIDWLVETGKMAA